MSLTGILIVVSKKCAREREKESLIIAFSHLLTKDKKDLEKASSILVITREVVVEKCQVLEDRRTVLLTNSP